MQISDFDFRISDRKIKLERIYSNIILYDMHIRPNEQYVPMCVVIGSRLAIRAILIVRLTKVVAVVVFAV